MIVAQAPAAPYVWDKQANVRSKDVNGVINRVQLGLGPDRSRR